MVDISTLSRTELLKKLKVEDLMTREVLTIDYDDLIGKAARLMIENHVHSLLVIKYGKPTYMVSTYDLIRVSYEEAFNEGNADMLRTPVESLVKGQNLVSVTTDTSLLDALALFVQYSIHSLPVIDDGNVMGILTLMDLAKWYKKTHE
ncbi:MAG TPA: CBS domain-containing protein [Leptospiraceae bacterium]|nr:CBS domain-containing protein [Leptospiraceae bacterium]HMW06421.1 CBS domain-containing protein [Leptospiraceae bacterium]HMX31509.1 CBS domain-containing protein [Leptospiraceae bacterium]HMY31953.1 CBS domain-containing protein [Leptospiraceae bacterium]HMZ63183.1 CBS domain-containing protein [Leptospiraceae bacterium]